MAPKPGLHRWTVPARISSLPWLVVSERGEQFTRQGIAYIIREAGTRAKLRHVWPLRHGLSRAQEHQEYHALHTHERAAVRGAVGLEAN